ncbi:MAG TPA: hypothetical protein VI968_00225 [archaeon]|nr:hypothetical protein [archaeon]
MFETTSLIRGLRKAGFDVVQIRYRLRDRASGWAILDKNGVAGYIVKYTLTEGPTVDIYKAAEAADKMESLAFLYTERPSEDVRFLEGEQPKKYDVWPVFFADKTFKLTTEGWVRHYY